MNILTTLLRSHFSDRKWALVVALVTLPFVAHTLKAQSLGYEGPTGVFVTPMAYTSPSPNNDFGRASVAYHVVDAGPVLGYFNTLSITEGYRKHFEFGYTGELHAGGNANPGGNSNGLSQYWTLGFNIIHAKVNFVPENYHNHHWVPAVAIGGIERLKIRNAGAAYTGKDVNNTDGYVVLTKMVKPSRYLSLLLNAGDRVTNASLWGLGGNAPAYVGRGFGAAGIILAGPKKSTIILAAEIEQQPKRLQGFTNFDIPTTVVYAVRIVPFAKRKFNVDLGCLEAAGNVALGVNLQVRNRIAVGLSYGF